MNDRITLFREQWSDRLLTALTLLVIVMLFVIAPLQASGLFVFQAFELAFALVLVAGVFVMSGSRVAVLAMLASLVVATIGGIHRITAPSNLDINLCGSQYRSGSRQGERAWSSGRLQKDQSQSMECSSSGPLVAFVTIRLAVVHAKDAAGTGHREADFVVRSRNDPSLRI